MGSNFLHLFSPRHSPNKFCSASGSSKTWEKQNKVKKRKWETLFFYCILVLILGLGINYNAPIARHEISNPLAFRFAICISMARLLTPTFSVILSWNIEPSEIIGSRMFCAVRPKRLDFTEDFKQV